MDQLTFTLPEWVIYAWGFWCLLEGISGALDIYWSYLDRKLENMKRTVSHHGLGTLLMAVERKFPNETRFETALRYIKEAENKPILMGKE